MISEDEWENLQVSRLPKLKGKLYLGIKFGHDGTHVAMSVAAKTASGKVFVEVLDCQSIRNGNSWILNFLKQADWKQVVVDGANGQQLLANEMSELRLHKPILPTVKEIILANATFEQALYGETLVHAGQPSLAQVVTNCEKRNIGTSGGFGYRAQIEEHEIALMDSMILAHWACSHAKPAQKQQVYY